MLKWQWPWIIIVAVFVAGFAALIAYLINSARLNKRKQAAVYGLKEDLQSEYAQAQFKLWHTLSVTGAVLLALALVVTCLLLGRPSQVDDGSERSSNRDIVLCLDVSGSTLPYDHQVIDTYRDLVKHFKGERIGLSIFNSTSRTVFPLTDDYELVDKQLSSASKMLQGVETQDDIDKMSAQQYQQLSDWLEGTQNRKNATSLIGDGLVSCASMLPGFTYNNTKANEKREASIVLATDNVVSGHETYTLAQALSMTSQANITVDGLYSGPQSSEKDADTTEMKKQVEEHQGLFLTQSSASSVDELVRQINKRQITEVEENSRAALIDAPGWWTLAIAVLMACGLICAWRLRR